MKFWDEHQCLFIMCKVSLLPSRKMECTPPLLDFQSGPAQKALCNKNLRPTINDFL